MPGALRESLVGPPPGPSTEPPWWVMPEDLAGCVAPDTMVDLAEVCAAVSNNLFVLSGRRYKQRRLVVRPSRRIQNGCGWWVGYTGDWTMTPSGFSAYAFEETIDPGVYDLRLAGPVQQVLAVKVDGVDLDPGDVALFDSRYLYRVDPAGARLPWPQDQRVETPDTEPGTFMVSYVWGQTIPPGGNIAAKAWACYLANQLAQLQGEGGCGLPDKVTQLVRQGVTLSKLSALDFLDKGRTGIGLVDDWINVDNPNGLRRPATIASPDTMRGQRPA